MMDSTKWICETYFGTENNVSEQENGLSVDNVRTRLTYLAPEAAKMSAHSFGSKTQHE
jgi:hypothetical protein